ncbi:hypothetical protein HHK36_021406 [Tetracentron sinense]|uniref:DOG1 domain-containing protein n=1 Tax=Tetracentron sinense TaxID=13715 RepID=A0A834YTQ3_TETSI|nr:hypothetical protein HHK36_021406 [Tetracentron sinense]
MKRALSLPLLKIDEENYDVKEIAEQFKGISLPKLGEELSWEKCGKWRQEQRIRAARMEKQLKWRWELEELIEEQLRRFDAHYNRAMVPSRLKDVANLLMPKWTPELEMASLAWLGDWRPSAILNTLNSRSSGTGCERMLLQLIHDTRIEEAVIDQEMAEIQATCILHLPFGAVTDHKDPGLGLGLGLGSVQSEFKKIHRVIIKAQHLRSLSLSLSSSRFSYK